MGKRTAFALSLIVVLSVAVLLPVSQTRVASAAGTVRNFYVATEYDLGGPGYNVFLPQNLVVEEGDQVNITVINTGTSFQLNIQGQSSVAVEAGSQSAPAYTSVPVFTASSAGLFSFSTDKFPEVNGQIVVLPASFSSYNPSTQTRSFTQLVLPDFSGDGYDKFFPGVIVVNQGDTVNVSIRNTDDMPHGFAIAAYDLNVAVQPGTDQPDGSIAPYTTVIQSFTASKAGVFRWFCTTPCGPGHLEMVGQLVVLPTQSTVYNPDIHTEYSYLTIKPDYAGDNSSKYVPDTIFVNQNDFLYIKVRNPDTRAYGFSMPDYSVNNITIAAGNSSDLSETYIPASSLYANTAGVFEFSCSFNCGSGPNQMNGYLVVLPTQTTSTSPTPTSTPPPTELPFFYAELSVALIIIGIVVGVVLAAVFSRGRTKKT
jgi:heme/copper-type cytochrome/quinol oxidase subunit 2